MASQQQQHKRGIIGSLLDRFVAHSAGLPPESTAYTVQPVTIPLEGDPEGLTLQADLYQPTTTSSNNPKSLPRNENQGENENAKSTTAVGTLLILSPYGRRPPMTIALARLWAARAYTVLFVSVRGTHGSTGAQDPGRSDVVDGPRVVRWMRAQPWYTGSFATLGVSYLAYASLALLNSGGQDPLHDMAAAICLVGMDDFADLIYGSGGGGGSGGGKEGGGALWLPLLDWAQGTLNPMAKQDAQHKHSWWTDLVAFWRMGRLPPDGNVALKKSLPLLDGVRAHFGDETPWLFKVLENRNVDGDETGLWAPMRHRDVFATTTVPILLVGGWMDMFTVRTIEQFQQLRDRGCPVGLTMGPWAHMEASTGEGVLKEAYDWLEYYLAKKTTAAGKPVRQAPVRINVTGKNEWRWLPSWPPATKPLELPLDTNGKRLALSKDHPIKAGHSAFTFDPHDPTPSLGGPLLFGGGYVDDSALAKRADVLAFDTAPLDYDIEVLGKPHVELTHSSDNPHVDLFLRLCEVNSKGVSRNIAQVYQRLDPASVQTGQSVKIALDLAECAHCFKKGTSIRLIVAGGAFPHYHFNLGSGEDPMTGSTLRPARHTVHTGGSEGSKLVLPISLVS